MQLAMVGPGVLAATDMTGGKKMICWSYQNNQGSDRVVILIEVPDWPNESRGSAIDRPAVFSHEACQSLLCL